jgi:hypothetical protein
MYRAQYQNTKEKGKKNNGRALNIKGKKKKMSKLNDRPS